MKSSRARTVLLILLIILVAAQGILGGILHKQMFARKSAASIEDNLNVGGLIDKSILALRKELALMTWYQAQVYFHKGYYMFLTDCEGHEHVVSDMQDEMEHALHEHEEEEDAHTGNRDHGHEHNHAHEHAHFTIPHPKTRRTLLNPYVIEHVHETDAVSSMMPFYRLTTTLDPQFVRAYINGAWWLAHHFNKPDTALSYLNEGLSHNRNNYELLYMTGRVYFSSRQDYPMAIRYFKKALEQEIEDVDEKVEMLRYLAFAYEKVEQYKKAIGASQKGLSLNPEAPGFRTIITRCSEKLAAPSQNHDLK